MEMLRSVYKPLGKNSEWEPMDSLTMVQNSESSLKYDSEYYYKYFLQCSGGVLLRKTEKRGIVSYI